MLPLTLTYQQEATRCWTYGGGAADMTATADAMQKVCETIGLFNAEFLAVSDISVNTHN